MSREQWIKVAEEAIAAYRQASLDYAHRVRYEANLEADRPMIKVEAITRIMGTDNPLTHQPHSASSAEKVVEGDEVYRAYLGQQRDAVLAKDRAFTSLTVYRMRAELAIAVVATHRDVELTIEGPAMPPFHLESAAESVERGS